MDEFDGGKRDGRKAGCDIEWDREGMVLGDDPEPLLGLPEGLLALEGLPIMFHGAVSYPVAPSKVVAAAQHILDHRSPEQKGRVFHNQAEVMAFASQEFGWHTGKEMGFVAVGNYMRVPPKDVAVKEARAEELDCMIEMLKSGELTTREGSRKLFPRMSDEAFENMWKKHEDGIEEAKARQERQMDTILEKIRAERAARGESPDAPTVKDGTRWTERPGSRSSSCLGI